MYKCGRCGHTGHNSRTCGKVFSPHAQTTRKAKKPPPQKTFSPLPGATISDVLQKVENTKTVPEQPFVEPIVETMTAQDIETWWLLASGRSGKQVRVERTYQPSPRSRAYTYRENEVEWADTDTRLLLDMVKTATAQGTSKGALKKFLTFFGAHAKTELAKTSEILPAGLCCVLAEDKSVNVRAQTAQRGDLPQQAYDLLADNDNVPVRTALAGNSTTPVAVLRKLYDEKKMRPYLAYSYGGTLEEALARNPNCPDDIHQYFLHRSEQRTLTAAAVSNPRTRDEDVAKVWEECRKDLTSNQEICRAIMERKSTPAHIITEYAEFFIAQRRRLSWHEEFALLSISGHRNTPTRTLQRLHRRIEKKTKKDPYSYRMVKRIMPALETALEERGEMPER